VTAALNSFLVDALIIAVFEINTAEKFLESRGKQAAAAAAADKLHHDIQIFTMHRIGCLKYRAGTHNHENVKGLSDYACICT